MDISQVVIKQMQDKNKSLRPEMKFLRMDLMKMDFEENTFNVVIDKGTLDAIMADGSDEIREQAERYLCVSGIGDFL